MFSGDDLKNMLDDTNIILAYRKQRLVLAMPPYNR